MPYRACCLYVKDWGMDAPVWIHIIIAGANPDRLDMAIEMAREDEFLRGNQS